MLIPDWNSLDSVRRAHSDLEAAALVFFALLVVSEALAHLSGNEKRERAFDKIGIVFFAIAVLAEILATHTARGMMPFPSRQQGFYTNGAASDASKALKDSGTALSQAEDAISKTGIAEGAMKNAANEASDAQIAASDASTIAHDARQEAD